MSVLLLHPIAGLQQVDSVFQQRKLRIHLREFVLDVVLMRVEPASERSYSFVKIQQKLHYHVVFRVRWAFDILADRLAVVVVDCLLGEV